MRGVAAAAAVCALVGGAAACGSDDDGGTGGGFGQPKEPGQPGGEQKKPDLKPNGVEKLEADAIVDQAMDALKQATSVRVTGTANGGTSLELSLDNQDNCQGSIGMNGAEAKLIRKGEKLYVKPNGPFWEMFAGENASAAQALVGDRYLMLTPGADGYDDIASACDLNEVSQSMNEDGGDIKATGKGQVTEVDGVPAIEIPYTADDEQGTISVATVGKPYPLKAVTTAGEAGALTFSDYDQPLNVQVPPDSQVLDFSQLKQFDNSGGTGV